jgi:L-ascorbate metabolism protein UlaG (beta-lactamase superfamily)
MSKPAVATVVSLLLLGCAAVGTVAEGPRRARVEASSHWRDGEFQNSLPRESASPFEIVWAWLTEADDNASPSEQVPVAPTNGARFNTPPKDGLRVTWLGHSTTLVELDGARVLFDPVWSERTSPVSWAGPARFHPPPLQLAEVPHVDAIVVSHDHYDHLDYDTVLALAGRTRWFVVPLGVGAHLEYWGIGRERIIELDWWQSFALAGVTLTATPARHFSGRSPVFSDANETLWAGWAVTGPVHRVYYSGDTALFPELEDIGRRLGPFDLALIEVGQYNPMWSDVHLGPEQAVVALQLVRGELLVPVHWGTFSLSLHAWTEPVERLLAAARRMDVQVAIPRAGESIEAGPREPVERWWPRLPFRSAAEQVVSSSGLPAELAALVHEAHGRPFPPPEAALAASFPSAHERRQGLSDCVWLTAPTPRSSRQCGRVTRRSLLESQPPTHAAGKRSEEPE